VHGKAEHMRTKADAAVREAISAAQKAEGQTETMRNHLKQAKAYVK
jgi:hypothetical protein